jgi:glutamyl-tRNA(Gln) amidotransferase subunit E
VNAENLKEINKKSSKNIKNDNIIKNNKAAIIKEKEGAINLLVEDNEDPEYYKNIGFMCGLEIHQRLATSNKLFCSCVAMPIQDSIIAKITRYQRAVAGELGDVDRSAEFEELRNRRFIYNVHNISTCLVDIDEEPPHSLNQEALKIALAIAKAFKMKIVDELQPMRKEVVDGSDPSAFQRTTLVALDGKLKASKQDIAISSLFLEEESSSIISENEDEIIYDPSRLGIPLIEIDTEPYIKTPVAAKEIALLIGTILRITGKVQRGIGTIRQDVNVSIKGGARVEIKGMQELDKMDKFIKNEILRQQKLLEIRDELKRRNAKVYKPIDLTEIFKTTKVKIIANQLEKNGIVKGFKLVGFKNLLGMEVNPNRRLGSEISDYAKMAKVNGLIHSDEVLANYGFTEKELASIKQMLEMDDNDSFIIIAGSKDNVDKALFLAMNRAEYALIGVPLETRGIANLDLCTTKFLRPLPSGSRMYPETDTKPIFISNEMIKEAERDAPDLDKERNNLYNMIQNRDIADQLLLSPKLQLYKTIIRDTKADPNFVAIILIQKFTALRRAGYDVDNIKESNIVELFKEYAKGSITKQAVEEILKFLKDTEDIISIIKEHKLERISGIELDKLIEKTSNEIKSRDQNILRNSLMSKYKFNISGDELMKKLQALQKKV